MALALRLRGRWPAGFTLLELLLVITMLGILSALAVWGAAELQGLWQVRRAGEQLLNDLKRAQQTAELAGNMTVHNGVLVSQRTFLVFAPTERSYAVYRWLDLDQDGLSESGESARLWQQQLPPGVDFGWSLDVNRKACSNVAGAPSAEITFATPNYATCNDQPCLKFDREGFSVIGPGAIYLTQNQRSLAITGTRPGHFTLCRWDGARWR